jgi:acetamidase/formamidase
MCYPLQVPGALLSVGDPHVSQGDGEVSGTALESSLNGLLRLTIRRDLPFTVPTLETPTELLVHGFGDTLDAAMKAAAPRTLDVLEVVDQREGVHGRIDNRCFPTWPLAA